MTHRVDILVVLEPAAAPEPLAEGDGTFTAPEGTPAEDVGARLLAEAARLAAMTPLSLVAPDAGTAVVGAVTWRALEPDADLSPLAQTLAAHARDRGAHVVLCPDTDLGRSLTPLVAAALDTCAILGVTDAVARVDPADGEAGFTWVKPVFGGHLEQELTFRSGAVEVVAVAPALLPPVDVDSPRFDVVTIDLGASSGAGAVGAGRAGFVRRVGLVPPDHRTVDLVHARRIVAAGSGAVGGADGRALALVAELAELLEGSVGATRPVTDDGRLPKERLIGQTGKTVAPDLYLALGVSGSPHHMAGVQGAQHILAVNRDPAAPILSFSDTAFVGDLRQVLPELIALIKAWRDGGAEGDTPSRSGVPVGGAPGA